MTNPTESHESVLAEMREAANMGRLMGPLEYEPWADRLAAAHAREVGDRDSMLAQCFKLAGADPDGGEDWRVAPRAVEAVRDLRRDYDEACEELHGPNGWKPRAEAAEGLARKLAVLAKWFADEHGCCPLTSEQEETIKAASHLSGKGGEGA